MATATMIASSPHERSSRGLSPRSHIDVQSRSKCDFLERFFSWSETVICGPQHTTGTTLPVFNKPADGKPNNDDILEYVFENGDSFTDHTNDDNNSEVEQGQGHKRALRQSSDHDLLDVWFDHVESLVCTDDKNEAVELAPIPTVPVVVGSPHPSRKKRSLTTRTTTRIGNHRGANKTRTTTATQTANPTTTTTTASTTNYYGLYQEGIVPVRAKKLKINSPTNNRTGIVSC